MPVEVSVVIPTRDRPAAVSRLLEALARQSIPAGRFEVILVDDGSTIPASRESAALPVKVLRNGSSQGPAAARNRGWQAAKADLVTFIDDDCVPAEGWLEAILNAMPEQGAVLQGRVTPMPEERAALRPLSHTIEVGQYSPIFVSANITYPRALLEQLGGFDETFRRACGEDAELGARVLASGAAVKFSSEAEVFHEVRAQSLGDHLRHTAKWTDGVRALAMHPELRDLLVARLFWKPTHPWLMAATAALLARRPRLAVLVAMPYLRHYWRLYAGHRRELPRALPRHVVIDAWEVVTVVRGSVEHHTLML